MRSLCDHYSDFNLKKFLFNFFLNQLKLKYGLDAPHHDVSNVIKQLVQLCLCLQ